MASNRPLIRHPMVGWYDPGQLLRTGIEVAISTIFGRHADARLMESLSVVKTPKFHDLSEAATPDFWFDFVSDTGDGFDPTYAVARAIATDACRTHPETEPPQLLVFGGDQVYPAPTREAYQQRLEDVYRAAFADSTQRPKVFAIPGNHDWYDSLVAFRRLFCTGREFAGCPTEQVRSYFALKLPQRVWLFAFDIQLSSDIDGPQLSYFDKLCCEDLQPEDRVILLVPEPFWIYRTMYPDDAGYSESNLDELKRRIEKSGARVLAFLAGDLHHYMRFTAIDGHSQLITAGGGGAFLHPTHGMRAPRFLSDHAQTSKYVATEESGELKPDCAFPSTRASFWLTFQNLKFPLINPRFALAMGLFYACLTLAYVDNSLAGLLTFWAKFNAIFLGEIEPLSVFATLFVVGLFVLVTDTHRSSYRILGGGVHATAHIVAALLLYAASEQLLQILHFDSLRNFGWGHLLWHFGVLGISGALVGPLLLGAYLLVSLNVLGRHSGESFSSLKIPDYKNFLRFKIAADGSITLYAFGIRRVPRRWSEHSTPKSLDKAASGVHLIELKLLA